MDSYNADQSEVWRDVDDYLQRAQVHSGTRAFADAADQQQQTMEGSLQQMAPLPDQVGLAAIHRGEVVALDLFGSASLYSRAWRKVTRGLLLEDYPAGGQNGHARQLAQHALEILKDTPVTRKKAPGAGHTLHGEHQSMVVGAVVHQGHVFHAFAAQAG